jgi:hypothetical protein
LPTIPPHEASNLTKPDMAAAIEKAMAALSEVTVEDFADGRGEDVRAVRRVKFKLYDKRAALVGSPLSRLKRSGR